MAAEIMLGGAAAVAGDVAADSGAGDAGDAGEETQVLSGGDTGDEGQGDESSQQTDENSPDDQKENSGDEKGGDARKLIGEARAQIAELRKTNPKLADFAQKSIFKTQGYEKLFPTVKDAETAKAAIEELGGDEGIANLRQSSEALEHIDKSLAAGDVALVDDMLKDFPDGTAKLIVDGVGKLKTLKPEAYAQLEDGMVHGFLEGKNVYGHVQYLLDQIQGGSQDKALEAAKILNDFMQHHKTNGAKKSGAPSDEASKLAADRKAFEEQKATDAFNGFAQKVLDMTNPVVTTQCKEILTSLLPKGFKLPSPTEDAILEDVFSKINAALNKNPNYSKRWNGLINEAKKTGDVNRVHKFVMSNLKDHLPELVKASKSKFVVGSVKPQPKVGQKGAGGQPAPKGVINRKPTLAESRLSKEAYLNGIGQKKIVAPGGQTYQWV